MRRTQILALCLALLALAAPTQAQEPEESQEDLAVQWVYDTIVKEAPPGRKVYYPQGQETAAEAKARYRSIARDIVEVVYHPSTQPLFKGPSGRSRTAAVVLALMFHESSFMRHVDYGLGKYARGDQGRSWCLMQLNIGKGRTAPWNIVHNRRPQWGDPPEEVVQGYTGPELIEDRRRCIREGLKVARGSFGACEKRPLLLKLAAYASGTCSKGHYESRVRMSTALRFFAARPRPFNDFGVQLALLERLPQEPKNTRKEAKMEAVL